ncbi:MAG TPA: dihydroxyacetone kinase transcriptional activator DhaS, partial [Ruminococcaceae bacterium]|nr:dihydroxyacetone kinase transcriptional activator DhaS [Oscillospiraceae bacterium]
MSDSQITKKAIAVSLKQLMDRRGLKKITVSDIVRNCGLNRQTFYYHFEDKYDLINWIFYNDVIKSVVSNRKTYDDLDSMMLKMLGVMESEKPFYMQAFNSAGQDTFQKYFFDVTKGLISEILDTMKEAKDIEDDDKNFIVEFYTYGLVGIIAQWVRNGMKEAPEKLVGRLRHFIDDSKRFA